MTEEKGLAIRQPSIIQTFDDASRAASAMAASGYFQDSRQAGQALVKILAGQEMGFGPFASMTGINIIQGRPSIGANLMAAAVKASGRYDYRVEEMTDKACTIIFYQGRDKIGVSTFTIEDARKAGTKNLDKFPRNMLFARAISNGVRWYCPDAFNGAAVYTPEELGATVNEDGDVIDVPVIASTILPVTHNAPPEVVKTETNGSGKPKLILQDPIRMPEEPTAQDAPPDISAFDALIAEVAAEKNTTPKKLLNAIQFSQCGLDPNISKEALITWLNFYGDARRQEMTPQEAGVHADGKTMEAIDLGAV